MPLILILVCLMLVVTLIMVWVSVQSNGCNIKHFSLREMFKIKRGSIGGSFYF